MLDSTNIALLYSFQVDRDWGWGFMIMKPTGNNKRECCRIIHLRGLAKKPSKDNDNRHPQALLIYNTSFIDMLTYDRSRHLPDHPLGNQTSEEGIMQYSYFKINNGLLTCFTTLAEQKAKDKDTLFSKQSGNTEINTGSFVLKERKSEY